MKRKFNLQRLGKLIKIFVISWIIFWFALGVYGITSYSSKNCQSVQKEYTEQLSNFKKEAELQKKKKAELTIEFNKASPKVDSSKAEEFLLRQTAEEEYLKQNGINLDLFPTGIIIAKGRAIASTEIERIAEVVFEKENPETISQKNYCVGLEPIGRIGILLGVSVLIFYLLYLYIFPRMESVK